MPTMPTHLIDTVQVYRRNDDGSFTYWCGYLEAHALAEMKRAAELYPGHDFVAVAVSYRVVAEVNATRGPAPTSAAAAAPA